MRRTLIVGNWKMNLNVSQASLLVHRLHERIPTHRDIEVELAPTSLTLHPMSMQIDRRKFRLAAQNAYHQDEGTFTGEISFTMLQELAHYAIIGHSERRYKFNELDKEIGLKVAAALRNNIVPILCVGETNSERLAGEMKQVLHDQIMVGLHQASKEDIKKIVVAYEPVWAISDGKDFKNHEMPSPADVAEATEVIRHNVRQIHGKAAEEKMRVIYGGSINPDNARAYLNVDGVDGLLVGGASLNYHQFSEIVDAAYRHNKG